MPLSWFEDPSEYLIDLRPGPADRLARIQDAYGQWVMGHGAQFNLTEEFREPGSNPADFNFAIAYRDLDAPKGQVVPSVPSGPAGAERVREGRFIGRLPVRAQSVAPALWADGAAEATPEPDDDWDATLPGGLDVDRVVIMGVMDDAIQVANPRFRDFAGRSRVDAAWVQDAPFDAPGQSSGTVGPGWALHRQFGRVLSRRDITDAIAMHGADDVALMEALDLIAAPGAPYQPALLRRTNAHGTHVADLAAGYDPEDDAKHRRIVAVQLPVFATQDSSGASLTAPAIAGAGFIFDRATRMSRALGQPIPVMLNFSYGLGGGDRRGRQVLERALMALANAYRADMVAEFGTAPPAVTLVPSGNGLLSRSHARGASPTDAVALNLRVQPDDRSSSFLEFWVDQAATGAELSVTTPEGVSHSFTLSLPPPGPRATAPISQGQVLAEVSASGDPVPGSVVARVSVDGPSHYPRQDGVDGAARILLSLAPTRALVPGRPVVSPGLWQVSCQATGASEPIEAWVQRDDQVMGFGLRGRQSYLQDEAYDANLFDRYTDIAVADKVVSPVIPVSRDGTVSSLSTRAGSSRPGGAELVSVAAGRWDINGVSLYSAAGFAPQNDAQVSVPADTSRVLGGILSTTNRGGAKAAQTGTSMAAPQVARVLADAVEGLAVEDYPSFSAATFLQSLVSVPVRPSPSTPELASNAVVRMERCAWGLLSPPAALEQAIARGTSAKT